MNNCSPYFRHFGEIKFIRISFTGISPFFRHFGEINKIRNISHRHSHRHSVHDNHKTDNEVETAKVINVDNNEL